MSGRHLACGLCAPRPTLLPALQYKGNLCIAALLRKISHVSCALAITVSATPCNQTITPNPLVCIVHNVVIENSSLCAAALALPKPKLDFAKPCGVMQEMGSTPHTTSPDNQDTQNGAGSQGKETAAPVELQCDSWKEVKTGDTKTDLYQTAWAQPINCDCCCNCLQTAAGVKMWLSPQTQHHLPASTARPAAVQGGWAWRTVLQGKVTKAR